MKIYKSTDKLIENKKCVLALGNFDGVHKGHAKLFSLAKKYAKEHECLFGVYTFEKHPRFDEGLLTLNSEKCELIKQSGADFVYLEDFDKVKALKPCDFVAYISDKFGAVCTVCGENFRFGKNAMGNCSDLKALMNSCGFDAIIVPTLLYGAKPISSTVIRSEIENGGIELANELLGYNYGFSAQIVHGARIGHTIGFPTVNQFIPKEKICPKHGVYVSTVEIDKSKLCGVTNIGIKPTVSSTSDVLSETYIIDFDGDLYGKIARISLYKLLRTEKKFSGLDELAENIKNNVVETKKYFEGNNI